MLGTIMNAQSWLNQKFRILVQDHILRVDKVFLTETRAALFHHKTHSPPEETTKKH